MNRIDRVFGQWGWYRRHRGGLWSWGPCFGWQRVP